RRHTRCLSDWSSDVCSSDLVPGVFDEDFEKVFARFHPLGIERALVGLPREIERFRFFAAREVAHRGGALGELGRLEALLELLEEIGRASCRERGWVGAGVRP